MAQCYNNKGEEIISLYLHSCEYGSLRLRAVPFNKGVKEYFKNGVSMNKLRSNKYTCNKTLNKIVDHLPVYIKYAKQKALFTFISASL